MVQSRFHNLLVVPIFRVVQWPQTVLKCNPKCPAGGFT